MELQSALKTQNLVDLELHCDLDQMIFEKINGLIQFGKVRMGVDSQVSSLKSLEKFQKLSLEDKEVIRSRLGKTASILESFDPEIEQDPSQHDEWPLIEKALKFYGLKLKDDFSAVLEKDDVVELYGTDHIQIFRTFNFYKYSAYTYMDLLVNEWFHLWERSSATLQSLHQYGIGILGGELKGIQKMDRVPVHVYKEIYNGQDLESFESRSVQCKFGHICAVYRDDGSIGGFLINCRVKVLSTGEEVGKLSFI